MNQKDSRDDGCDLTNRNLLTRILSAEFLISFALQAVTFLVIGTTVVNRIEARVASLEAQQVTDARIARIEEKLGVLLTTQADFKATLLDLQADLRESRREYRDSQRTHR